MPIYLCPNCAKQLQSASKVDGKQVRCLGCGTVFRATAPANVPPPVPRPLSREMSVGRPAKASAGSRRPNFVLLAVLFFGIVLMTVASGLGIYFFIRQGSKTPDGDPGPVIAYQTPATQSTPQASQTIGSARTSAPTSVTTDRTTEKPVAVDKGPREKSEIELDSGSFVAHPLPDIKPILRFYQSNPTANFLGVLQVNLDFKGRLFIVDLKKNAIVCDRKWNPIDSGLVAVSPDGSWFVSPAMAEGMIRVHSTADSSRDFSLDLPYGKKRGLLESVKWLAFLDNVRLLVLYGDGGFDVWSIERKTRITGHAARKRCFLKYDAVEQYMVNFGLSSDRSTVAVLAESRFILTNTTTGEDFKTLDAMPGDYEVSAAAYSAEIDRLICTAYPGNGTEVLLIWDSKTGKLLSESVLPKGVQSFNLGFWGREHLLVYDTGLRKADIFSVAGGKHVGVLRLNGSGKLSPRTPFGRVSALHTDFNGENAKFVSVAAPVIPGEGQFVRFFISGDRLTSSTSK